MKKIESALVSVFSKEGLEPIVQKLHTHNVVIYSTGGTQKFIKNLGIPVVGVETLTSYPSILDGRVKTLHPKVFGGILARREEGHLAELESYDIPEIDLVIVDLYPFEETVNSTNDESKIIEKIDIGGISLIRAAAKNFKDVVVVPSKREYGFMANVLDEKQGFTNLNDRKYLASCAFRVSAHYDSQIFGYFTDEKPKPWLSSEVKHLRYGENPHQEGSFYGNLSECLETLSGKELSYNNLVDVDAAMQLMSEFKDFDPTFAVLKHTNSCGLATRKTIFSAWKNALAGDNISAFGGILIANSEIDLETAQSIDSIFYEVLMAPSFSEEALDHLKKKKKRILLKIINWPKGKRIVKTILNGHIVQDKDLNHETVEDITYVTNEKPSEGELNDLLFANMVVKHLKSNGIALVKNRQLVGIGCGQTSRVDALKQAILKAKSFGFDLNGAVMASDAFFPFPDCVEIAHKEGIDCVIQPGGSIKDQDSIDFCNNNGMRMITTGVRHFKH
jgi:phosphoribosylaminoimidazolecarboxamide formyltransferase/IMP cyclohydrolase